MADAIAQRATRIEDLLARNLNAAPAVCAGRHDDKEPLVLKKRSRDSDEGVARHDSPVGVFAAVHEEVDGLPPLAQLSQALIDPPREPAEEAEDWLAMNLAASEEEEEEEDDDDDDDDDDDLAAALAGATAGCSLEVEAPPADPQAVAAEIQAYRALLRAEEATLGKEHPQVAATLNSMGAVLEQRFELGEALQLHWRALVIQERSLGRTHEAVAETLSRMGRVVRQQGDLTHAIQLYRRALTIEEAALGAGHPRVASTLNNLAVVLEQLGRAWVTDEGPNETLDEALALYARALPISEGHLGADHPEVAATLANMGLVLTGLRRYEEAAARYGRARAIQAAALGEAHPDTVCTLVQLGGVLRRQGKPAEAAALYRRALPFARAAPPETGGWMVHVVTQSLRIALKQQGWEPRKQRRSAQEGAPAS